MSRLTEDRALLERFRAGDREALDTVYRHYGPQVSALVHAGLSTRSGRVRSRSPFEVGAVVQEVFARAFTQKARAAYDGLTPFVRYLGAIARNYLLNELRMREDAAAAQSIEAAVAGSPDGRVAVAVRPLRPDEAAEANELCRLLSDFLGARPERERLVYRARFEEQLTQEDAARSLGLTRIQVRRSEAHLRRDLLFHLQRSGYLSQAPPQTSSLVASSPAEEAHR